MLKAVESLSIILSVLIIPKNKYTTAAFVGGTNSEYADRNIKTLPTFLFL